MRHEGLHASPLAPARLVCLAALPQSDRRPRAERERSSRTGTRHTRCARHFLPIFAYMRRSGSWVEKSSGDLLAVDGVVARARGNTLTSIIWPPELVLTQRSAPPWRDSRADRPEATPITSRTAHGEHATQSCTRRLQPVAQKARSTELGGSSMDLYCGNCFSKWRQVSLVVAATSRIAIVVLH